MLKNYLTPSAYQSLQAEKASRLKALAAARGVGESILAQYTNPADFINAEMYIPETPGAALQLHPEQYGVLSYMFRRNPDDTLCYMTMLYSSVKKSAKTTIGAAIALWQAYQIPNGEIYIVGNDLKQADNRMNQAIRYCIQHNPRMADVKVNRNTSYLPNGTKIEAVPVDAAGEAGPNPTGIFWTEAWGAKQRKHEEFWSEMALSPTRQGHSFKFVESYAGHSGESLILERLYNAVVKDHAPIDPSISPELYEDGSTVAYWNTRRYLPWQVNNTAYYEQEAKEKTPQEFRRQHNNEWVTSEDVFIERAYWEACRGTPPPMAQYAQVVVAFDAGITNDTFGIVAVSRAADETLAIRYARRWIPPKDSKLDFDAPDGPAAALRWLGQHFNVAEFAYDEWQTHLLATRLFGEGVGYFRAFSQGQERLVSDKQLYDIITHRKIIHSGEPELTEHILNANAKTDGDKLRIIKRADHLKIDLCVCLSMASSRAVFLNVT